MTLKAETLTPSKIAKVAATKDVALKAASNTVAKTKVETPAASPAHKAVSVETTPIAQGVSKMTDTVKATTEFFADVRVKASEAAEKGKKFAT